MVSSSQSKQVVYDEIRKKWVAATPEEFVRQNLLKKMIYELSYPRELLAIERALSEMPHLSQLHVCSVPSRRLDIVCFCKGVKPSFALYPLIIIECKEDPSESKAALEQVLGYNHYVQAYFVAIATSQEVQVWYQSASSKQYECLHHMPSFHELMQSVKI